jgi:vitamin B12 transporter
MRRILASALLLLSAAGCGDDASPPTLVNREEVAEAMAQAYPAELRDQGIGGEVTIGGMVDAEGRFTLDLVEPVGETDPRFGDAARRVLPEARFQPARVDGVPVAVRIQFPLRFLPPDAAGREQT